MRHRTIAAVAVAAGIAVTGCGSEQGTDAKPDREPQAAAQTARPAEPAKPKTKNDRLRDALADTNPAGAGEVDVQRIEFGKSLVIHLKTPTGGFSGPSDKDLNNSAAAAFRAVYGKAKYPATKETVVVFAGGLVSKATGKDLPDARTGIYTLKGSDARKIDWSDDDAITYNIDWSIYRDFIHPAIKQD